MINFTKRYVNTISLIISITIFCFFNYSVLKKEQNQSRNALISNQIQTQIKQAKDYNAKNVNDTNNENNKVEENTTKKEEKAILQGENKWQLEIPSIDLKAQIAEGTTKEIMDAYIGHFEETRDR